MASCTPLSPSEWSNSSLSADELEYMRARAAGKMQGGDARGTILGEDDVVPELASPTLLRVLLQHTLDMPEPFFSVSTCLDINGDVFTAVRYTSAAFALEHEVGDALHTLLQNNKSYATAFPHVFSTVQKRVAIGAPGISVLEIEKALRLAGV